MGAHAIAITSEPDAAGVLVSGAGLEVFLAAYRPTLLKRARKLCRGQLDADDLVQDALEKALRSRATMRDDANVKSWVLTILTHLFIDKIRKRHADPPTDPIDDLPLAAPAAVAASEWESVTREQLHDAVRRLPDDVRGAYELHALQGRDYDEVARQLGIPKGTVGSRLARARARLREIIMAELARGGGAS